MKSRITDDYGQVRPEDLPPAGMMLAREALASYERVSVDCVALTCGGSAALTAVLTVLRVRASSTRPGGLTVMLPKPHFPAYPGLAILCGFRPIYYEMPTSWSAVAVNSLLQTIRINPPAVFLVNSPHNPTGLRFPTSLVHQIADEMSSLSGSMIVDEAFAGIVLKQGEPKRIELFANEVRVGTFNKRFPAMADVRLGYILGDGDLVLDAALVHRTLSLGASVAAQQKLVELLRDDPNGQMETLCDELREHATLAQQILGQSPYLRCSEPDAGFFILVSLEDGTDPAAFARALRETTGLWCAAAPSFGIEEHPWIRLRLAVPMSDLAEHCRHIVTFAANWYERAGRSVRGRG